MISQKVLRAQSLLESGNSPNNESLRDTYMDLINYCSFAVTWLDGKMEGQEVHRDIFNRPTQPPAIPKENDPYAALKNREVSSIIPEQHGEPDQVVKEKYNINTNRVESVGTGAMDV
jgi:hypothetical protein